LRYGATEKRGKIRKKKEERADHVHVYEAKAVLEGSQENAKR